uniref:Uncharacterized protein n=1 Tax=Manihot esculenta TaxID=3983 RepID=A0A2C9U8U0_MANES
MYLRLQPHRQATMAMRHSLKLSTKFYGSFQLIEKIGYVAYNCDCLLMQLFIPCNYFIQCSMYHRC